MHLDDCLHHAATNVVGIELDAATWETKVLDQVSSSPRVVLDEVHVGEPRGLASWNDKTPNAKMIPSTQLSKISGSSCIAIFTCVFGPTASPPSANGAGKAHARRGGAHYLQKNGVARIRPAWNVPQINRPGGSMLGRIKSVCSAVVHRFSREGFKQRSRFRSCPSRPRPCGSLGSPGAVCIAAVVLGAGLGMLTLVGCGSDSDPPNPTASPSVTPTPAANSQCAALYADSISQPTIAPDGEIMVNASSVVRFDSVGSPEDSLFVIVNGQQASTSRPLELEPGRNTVDFLVLGEGEVHNWHVTITVNDTIVFEHKQITLEPRHVCDDEMYQYRLVFTMG